MFCLAVLLRSRQKTMLFDQNLFTPKNDLQRPTNVWHIYAYIFYLGIYRLLFEVFISELQKKFMQYFHVRFGSIHHASFQTFQCLILPSKYTVRSNIHKNNLKILQPSKTYRLLLTHIAIFILALVYVRDSHIKAEGWYWSISDIKANMEKLHMTTHGMNMENPR